MKVIVDTSVWSLALRRNKSQDSAYVSELEELVRESRVQLIGAVRQELLSGIKSEKQYHALKTHLRAFGDLAVETEDYELASAYFNKAREKGVQGSNTDFLICALSTRHKMPILTTDKDFIHFQKAIPLELHTVRA